MMNEAESSDSLIGHLRELRKRLFYSLIFIFIGFVACWSVSDLLFNVVREPIQPFLKNTGGGLIFTAPMDKFLSHLKVAFLGGVILSCPLWMYQIWRFIAPGLYQNEKKYGISFIFFGSILFFCGVSFVYFVVFPMAFQFLMTFGGGVDQAMITIKEYLGFFITVTLVFGMAFEMPLILTILGMMGVVTHEFLSAQRRFAIVGLAALSAMATPPDVLSMVLMMGPMVLLYESSIILVRIFGRRPESV